MAGRGALSALRAGGRGLARAGSWWWETFLEQPLAGLIVIIFGVTVTTLAAAFVVRIVDPESALLIRPFEVQSGPPADIAVTGRTVADGLYDQLDRIVRRGEEAAGGGGDLVAAPGLRVRTPEADLSPIGVHVSWFSFSLESVLAGWNLFRRRNLSVSGDLILEEAGLTLRARSPGHEPWETRRFVQTKAGLDSATRVLAVEMLGRLQPRVTAHYLWSIDEHDRAEPFLESWAEREPRSAEPWAYLAVSRQLRGAAGEAVDAYRRALSRDTTLDLLINLGTALVETDRLDEAAQTLDAALERNPGELERALIQQARTRLELQRTRGDAEDRSSDGSGTARNPGAAADAHDPEVAGSTENAGSTEAAGSTENAGGTSPDDADPEPD